MSRVGYWLAAASPELGVVCAFLATLKTVHAYNQVPAWPLNNLRDAVSGDLSQLDDEQREELAAYRAITASTVPHSAGGAIGLVAEALVLVDGNDSAAWPTAREAVAHARASRNPTAIAFARFAEGRAAADADPAAALAALEEAGSVAADVDCRLVSALALTLKVALRGRHGSPDQALALFHDVIALWRATANETLLITVLSNLVILLARTGRDAEAVELAATLRHATHTAVYAAEAARIDAALARARRRLGARRYDAVWSIGAQRGVDEAAKRAQQLLEVPSEDGGGLTARV